MSTDDDQDVKPPVLSYASQTIPERLVTLKRLPPMEGELAAAKLQSEGIRCYLIDQNISMVHPAMSNEVRLQVAEADLERGLEILARPAGEDAQGEYVDEPWRCPRCHRKGVDLLPLSSAWRRARMICAVLWLAPFVLMAIRAVFPWPAVTGPINRLVDLTFIPWLFATAILTILVLTARRSKRCRDCGHEWQKGDS